MHGMEVLKCTRHQAATELTHTHTEREREKEREREVGGRKLASGQAHTKEWYGTKCVLICALYLFLCQPRSDHISPVMAHLH